MSKKEPKYLIDVGDTVERICSGLKYSVDGRKNYKKGHQFVVYDTYLSFVFELFNGERCFHGESNLCIVKKAKGKKWLRVWRPASKRQSPKTRVLM